MRISFPGALIPRRSVSNREVARCLQIQIEANCAIVRTACGLILAALWIASGWAQPRKMIKADDGFNGRRLELRVGETLELSLSENASTGYRWTITPESTRKLDKILHERGEAPEGAAGTPGKAGVRRFYLEASEPGAIELELEYRRPFEPARPPARRFKLRIRVVPAAER